MADSKDKKKKKSSVNNNKYIHYRLKICGYLTMSVPRYDTGKVKEDTYESLILIKAGNNILCDGIYDRL